MLSALGAIALTVTVACFWLAPRWRGLPWLMGFTVALALVIIAQHALSA